MTAESSHLNTLVASSRHEVRDERTRSDKGALTTRGRGKDKYRCCTVFLVQTQQVDCWSLIPGRWDVPDTETRALSDETGDDDRRTTAAAINFQSVAKRPFLFYAVAEGPRLKLSAFSLAGVRDQLRILVKHRTSQQDFLPES